LYPGIVIIFYLNSVLFEVRNVFTSLLGLVIVPHLSPKESERFSFGPARTLNRKVNLSLRVPTQMG
jgi:hypothetical protein